MASALLRQHCDADSAGTEVLQLSGGIERYLEAYPSKEADASSKNGERGLGKGDAFEGCVETAGVSTRAVVEAGRWKEQEDESFFRGKNFVFDER